MTPKQAQLLQFLKDNITDEGVVPSYDEMAAGIGIKSKSGVHRLITGLEAHGAIGRIPARTRSIYLTDQRREPAPRVSAAEKMSFRQGYEAGLKAARYRKRHQIRVAAE